MNPQIAFLLNKSLESLRNSNLESAELYLKQALRFQSNNPDVLRLLGVLSAQKGEYAKALEYLGNSLKAFPKNALALSNLGNVYLELKEYSSALEAYDKSIKIDPKYAEVWSNKGNVLNELKRHDEAIIQYDKALSLQPEYAEAWSNKGNTLHALRRHDDAIACYDKALSLQPEYAEAWSNKGWCLHVLKRHEEAIAHYDKALSLKPDYAEAWYNKGNTLHALKRHEEAIVHHDKALVFKPEYADGWVNRGMALLELKRYDEAIANYEKALSIEPDFNWLQGHVVHAKMKSCRWSDLEISTEILINKILENQKISAPFPLQAMIDDAHVHKKASEIYIQDLFPVNSLLGSLEKFSKKEKIRIGYFSADFKFHAVSILTAELFELHDKNKFEIIAFSFGVDDKSAMRSRLGSAFDKFIDVSEMSSFEIAKLSRDLHIDIAVDLGGGHTANSRTEIFSYRAAPIQLSYIGYLGTMGSCYYDYILADRTIIPDNLQKHYDEKIAYLPCYQVNDRKRIISERQFTREELGIPKKGFVFCCFNNNYKILPSTFNGWMRILRAVEGSVLFLYADSEDSKINLVNEANARGIESERLVFGRFIPAEENLARYQVCDLFLDTSPYNAGVTASDALWAGLPVLTLLGQSFASRYAASLLNSIGLPELITNTQEEYEALAIALARNPQNLTEIKLKLANNRLTAPLFDSPLFTKNLEAAYIKMYERYQADLPPEHISIG